MERHPQHPDEGDRFEAVLREHHKLVRQFAVATKDLRDYFRENLPEATRDILEMIPRQREAWRQEALRKYGYDLERSEWTSSPEETIKSPDDVRGFVALSKHYHTYRLVMEQWEWFVQIGLTGKPLQLAVCESVIEAYRHRPGLAAHGIEWIEAATPGFPQGLALTAYLTTHVAAHTSLHRNLRLRARIDELRTDDESRFSRLLKELPAEVLAAYREREAGWGDLMDVRTEAARRLEMTDAQPELQELATFAEQEALRKKAREAGLTPREHELFKFFLENPGAKNADAARALGIAVGTVRSSKSKIKKALGAA